MKNLFKKVFGKSNQKGSLAYTMVILMLVLGTVASLSTMALSDRSNETKGRHMIQKSLNEDSIFEVIYFSIASKLDDKYYGVDNKPILTNTEVTEIKNEIQRHLSSAFQETSGKKVTVDSVMYLNESIAIQDVCSNVNTCTFEVGFDIQLTDEDGQHVYSVKITNLQWNNVSSEDNPVYHVSALHGKWRFEIK